jgi:hypothetical protein
MKVNQWTRSFVFKSIGPFDKCPGIQDFYSDLSMLGKHFTVISLKGDAQIPHREVDNLVLRRHYTICNAMKKRFYVGLLNALQGKEQLDTSLLQDENGNEVNLTIKTYNLQQGLASRFFNNPEEVFQIKGPMGRGLELNQNS